MNVLIHMHRNLLHHCMFKYSFAEIGEFQGLVGSFIEMVDGLAKEVEQEKMRAIGARNLLKSIAKERESQKQQLQALIAEKKMQLERCVCVCMWVGAVGSPLVYLTDQSDPACLGARMC